jgi:hypothetical protein
MVQTLRRMLREALTLRSSGAAYARLAQANGVIDGYMQALLDAGLVQDAELLAIVSEIRKEVDGPATGEVSAVAAVS